MNTNLSLQFSLFLLGIVATSSLPLPLPLLLFFLIVTPARLRSSTAL